jgi:hypothetical protein
VALSKAGPAGGHGGVKFDDNQTDTFFPRRYIAALQVNSGDTIDHIRVKYLTRSTGGAARSGSNTAGATAGTLTPRSTSTSPTASAS